MARLPALIDAIAACDPRGRATVEHVARLIREAGYIQTTKRGKGAAEMTERDAVALLVGLNGSENLHDAPEAVKQFEELVVEPITTAGGLRSELVEIVRSKRFVPALEMLLLAVPALERMRDESERLRDGSRGGGTGHSGFGLSVRFHMPELSGSILIEWIERLHGQPIARDLELRYRLPKASRHAVRARQFDRSVAVCIGMQTFLRVHRGLRPDNITEAAN